MTNNFIGEGLKSDGVNLNVLNILRSLLEDKDSIVYIPQDYKRGAKSYGYDSKVHMIPAEAGKPIQVISLTSNQKRFNFSVLGLMDIVVENEDETTGEVSLVPKKVWRQYNIVRDSELMMDYIVAKLSENSFTALRDAGILYYNGVSVPKNHKFMPDFIYKVKLSDLPIVSCNWARPVTLGLYQYMLDDMRLTSELKVVNALLKKYKEEEGKMPTAAGDSNIYAETNTSSDDSDEHEYYEASCIVYELKDVATEDPSTEDSLREKYPEFDSLDGYRKSLKKSQDIARFNSRCIIMAIENSAKKGSYDWSELEDVPRSKNKKQQFCTIDVGGKPITMRRLIFVEKVSV